MMNIDHVGEPKTIFPLRFTFVMGGPPKQMLRWSQGPVRVKLGPLVPLWYSRDIGPCLSMLKDLYQYSESHMFPGIKLMLTSYKEGVLIS